MTAVAVSAFTTSIHRYGRSFGLWLLLLVAPIGARFLIAGQDATGSIISAEGRIPVLTSAFMGAGLGIIITTLLLPIAYIYLRANVTRRQPWQVEEVSPASRIAIAYGRWAADVAALLAVLTATTLAGIVLAYLLLPFSEVNPAVIAFCLWVIAGPAVVLVASIRLILESRRWTRGWLGDVLYFIFWMASIIVVAAYHSHRGFGANMLDANGFMAPLAFSLDANANFTIGGGMIVGDGAKSRILLDVLGGILSDGYLASRAVWLGIAALIPLLAGLVYLPHVAGKTRRKPVAWLQILEPGAPPKANPLARPASSAALPFLGLVLAEARLMAGSRKAQIAVAALAIGGWFLPWSTAIGPAAMLLLVFASTAHAGRSEQRGLLALTRTGLESPMARRLAFVFAGVLVTLEMSIGAIAHGLTTGELRPLIEACAFGGGTALTAITLGALTRSATAPRLLLLIAWYLYLNWGSGN